MSDLGRQLDVLTDQALICAEEFEQYGEISHLDEAIRLFTAVVERGHRTLSDRARHLDNLSVALLSRYGATQRADDLAAAMRYAREATDDGVPPHPSRALHLSNLCNTALTCYDVRHDDASLDEAVEAGTRAVSAASIDDPDLPLYKANLHAATSARFDRLLRESGDLLLSFQRDPSAAILDRAIVAGRAAIAVAPLADERRWTVLSNTSSLLRQRYEDAGEDVDLDECVRLAREATVAAGPSGAASCAVNLSAGLLARFFERGDRRDADEVVALCHRAMGQATDAADRALLASNLVGALQGRAAQAVGSGAARRDFDEAVVVSRDLVETAPVRLDREVYRANLANALLSRAWAARIAARQAQVAPAGTSWYADEAVRQDVEEAVRQAHTAVHGLALGSQEWARSTANLATAYSTRWSLSGDRADATNACDTWTSLVTSANVPTAVRVAAADDALALSVEAGLIDVRLPMAMAAVELLPLLAWPGLQWRSRVLRLTRWQGLAGDAAAAALATRQSEIAVVLAEHGRSVLWAQRLDRRRDVARLANAAPSLADELARVRRQLDRDA